MGKLAAGCFLGVSALALCSMLSASEPAFEPFLLLLPAVILAGWLYGLAAGCLVIVVGASAAGFLWPPDWRYGLILPGIGPLADLAFVAVSALLLWGVGMVRRSLGTAEAARAALDVAERPDGLAEADARQAREADAKFRALSDGIPGLLFFADAEGRNTYVNQTYLERTGATQDELLGLAWYRLVHPDDVERVRSASQAAIVAGVGIENEFRLRDRSGAYRWLLINCIPVRDADGQVAGWCGIGIDIEDRKRAEAALNDNEKRLRLAVEAGALGTWEVDLETRKRCWTPRLAEMFGLAAAETEIGAGNVPDFVHPDDLREVVDHFEEGVATGELSELEFRVFTVTGELRWVASSGLVIEGHDGRRRMIGAMRDVTERRRREEALREALAAREMLVREADHRIKNSLQLVVGLLTLQQKRLTDPEASAALASAAARVQSIAESHYALQQSEDLRTVDLSQAMQELCGRLGHLSPGVVLECETAGQVLMDAERAIPLALIVSELLTNAMRHAYPGGKGLVSVSLRASGGVVRITVGDEGVGFGQDEEEPGLGSTVIQSLSRQVGAEVVTRSRPGAGTVTTVTVPV